MAIFSEHFPVNKDKIVENAALLKKKEEAAASSKQAPAALSTALSYTGKGPRELKINQKVVQMRLQTIAELEASKGIEEELKRIRGILDDFDNIKEEEAGEQSQSKATAKPKPHVHRVKNSLDNENDNAESWIPYVSQKKIKPMPIRQTKASILKSEHTRMQNSQRDKQQTQTASSTPRSSKKEKMRRMLSRSHVPQGVRKILDDAKRKHLKIYQQQPRTIPPNVLDLKLTNK